ncbi:zinc-ribbon domain-containing protein [Stigmatella sp. ncwal1]|uniref:Zinc-ribbon domain-containing protein n=1 Tax=Stigmatella ashevillensis TaxID=2995309 RepID=A0ABT5D839_9BACT|nr:zinc-ribbon domain-containing protein [Stigmatella ashevillena]MDC0709822.1 zinc-ribbon domain-containing protein [Stigmatella ashevillena]
MIVQCEQCQTRFKIPDEKVTEKGVKVRCTKCQHTFRVSRAPAGATPGASSPPVPGPADGGFDPFERFGTAPEPKPGHSTRPGFFAEGVEASRTGPAPQAARLPPSPWNAMDSGMEGEVHDETTRVLPIQVPPEARPPVPSLPPLPLDPVPPVKTPSPLQGAGRPGATPFKPSADASPPGVAASRGPAAAPAIAPGPKAPAGARSSSVSLPAVARPAPKPAAPPPEVPPAADLFAEFFANPGAAPSAPLPELPLDAPTSVPPAAAPPGRAGAVGGMSASFGFGDKGSFGSVDTDLSEPAPDLGPAPELFDAGPRFPAPPPPVAAPPPKPAPVAARRPSSTGVASVPAGRPAPVVAPASAPPQGGVRPTPFPVPTSSAAVSAPVARPAPVPPVAPPAPVAPTSAMPFMDEDPFGPSNIDLGAPTSDLGFHAEPEPAPAPVAAPAPASFSFSEDDPFGSVGVDLSAPSHDELSAPVPAALKGRPGPSAVPPAPAAPARPAPSLAPRSSAPMPADFDEFASPFGAAESPAAPAPAFAPPGPMEFGMLGDDEMGGGSGPPAEPAVPFQDPFASAAADAAPPEDPFAQAAHTSGIPDPFAQAAHTSGIPDPFAQAAEPRFSPTETGRQLLGSADPSQGFLTETNKGHQVISPTDTGRSRLDLPPRGMQEEIPGLETGSAQGGGSLLDVPPQESLPAVQESLPAPSLGAPSIARPAGRPADMGIPERRKPSAAQQVTGQVAYLTIAGGLLLALTAVGSVYLKEGRVDAAALSPSTLLELVTPSDFVARNVSNGLYDTRGGGAVFYVRGEVENRSSKPVRIKVRSALYDGGQRVKATEGLAGKVPTPEELYGVTHEDSAAQLRTQLDAAAATIAPGARAPFIVLYHDYPQELGQLRLEVKMEAVPEESGKP